MILQALCEYYDRKAANSDESLAPQELGMERDPFFDCAE